MSTLPAESESESSFLDAALDAALGFPSGKFGIPSHSNRQRVPVVAGRQWGKYKYWAKKDVDRLRRMAEDQVRTSVIARRFNLSVRAVRARAAREGIRLVERGRVDN